MKILFLSEEFPPENTGGAGLIAYNLARELNGLGHDIFVVTHTGKKSDEGETNLNGLKIFKVYGSYHPRWQSWLSLYNPLIISKIRRVFKKIKPDVIHAHNIHYYFSYHSLKLAKKYSKAVFLTVHDVMPVNFGKLLLKNNKYVYKVNIFDQIKEAGKRYNPFRNTIIRHYLKYVDKIFAVSNSLKELLEINGLKNIQTIYNGIDVNEWELDGIKVGEFKNKHNLNEKKVIIFSGRLIEAKGGDQLIKSLALVNREFSNFVLLVVGKEWAYTEKIKKISQDLGLEKKLMFTGYLKENELKLAYNSADVSIFPSLCFEGFGMANLEAMACRKPTISTFFGGPSEVVIDGETGNLINPNNIKLMSEKIIDLLKNSEKAKKFGEAGYQRAKKFFSLDKQLKITLEYYYEK